MTTISVVTPWWNHEELATDYFAAVEDELRVGDQLLIVDNASDPPLTFAKLRAARNLGFCGGSNLGLRQATADAVVFLNNDVHDATPGWLDELRAAVEPGVLAGPLLDPPWAVVDGLRFPYIAGWCCAGMRADLLELGGFDESLDEPGYYSDNLLSLEARAAGMTLRDVRVRLGHREGVTARDSPQISRAAARNRELYIDRVRGVLAAAT